MARRTARKAPRDKRFVTGDPMECATRCIFLSCRWCARRSMRARKSRMGMKTSVGQLSSFRDFLMSATMRNLDACPLKNFTFCFFLGFGGPTTDHWQLNVRFLHLLRPKWSFEIPRSSDQSSSGCTAGVGAIPAVCLAHGALSKGMPGGASQEHVS